MMDTNGVVISHDDANDLLGHSNIWMDHELVWSLAVTPVTLMITLIGYIRGLHE